MLGELKTTTVVVLNDDPFPGGETEIDNTVKIVKAFGGHLWHGIPSVPKWGLVFKVYPCLAWMVTQLMMMFSLNAIREYKGAKITEEEGFRRCLILAGAYLVSTAIWHVNGDFYDNLKLGGKARMILRKGLVSTMVQLTPGATEEYPTGKVLSIMSESVEDAVSTCWAGMFNLFGSFCQILVMTAFSAYLVRQNPYILAIPVLMMIIDVVILYCRVDTTVAMLTDYNREDQEWKALVVEMNELRPAPSLRLTSTITAPSLHHHCTITAPSLRQARDYRVPCWLEDGEELH